VCHIAIMIAFHVTAPACIFLKMQPRCTCFTCFEIFHCHWSCRKLLHKLFMTVHLYTATLVHPNGSAAPDEGTQMQNTQCMRCHVPKLSTVFLFIYLFIFAYLYLCSTLCIYVLTKILCCTHIYKYELGECRKYKTKKDKRQGRCRKMSGKKSKEQEGSEGRQI